MNTYIKQEEFSKVIDFFKKDITSLRTGRANPSMLDSVQVEVYGTKSPLNSLATINVPEARSIIISPWDKNVLKDIEKAVIAADLGVSAVNEGDKIRLTVPQLTEENRRDLVKKLNEKHEASRISIRQVRDEIKNDIEEAEKNKEIAEDDKFKFIKELDEEVGKQNNLLKEIRDKKEEEIMKI
ncbi:MAG: ribosome recycling factor [Candidatus Falkowbacteria bacterium]